MLIIMIALLYIVLALPWVAFAATGWLGFAVLGTAFLILAMLLLPRAKHDWNGQ